MQILDNGRVFIKPDNKEFYVTTLSNYLQKRKNVHILFWSPFLLNTSLMKLKKDKNNELCGLIELSTKLFAQGLLYRINFTKN